jgi:ferritin-like metal-binding protein YciE
MNLQTLQRPLHHQLKALYSAEEQILEALPKMVRATANAELAIAAAFQAHRKQTKEQAKVGNQSGLFLTRILNNYCSAYSGGRICETSESLAKGRGSKNSLLELKASSLSWNSNRELGHRQDDWRPEIKLT